MRTKKRIVISGASGFLGTHLTRFFVEKGFEVHALVRSDSAVVPAGSHCHNVTLSDFARLSECLERLQPTFLIHTAAGASHRSAANDFSFQYENTTIPAITLASSLPSSLKQALFLGSCAEYGDGPAPFREGQALHPLSPYGWAKASAFTGCRILALTSKVPICWARPGLVFGSGQDESYLVSSVIKRCLANEIIPLTTGDQLVDYLYVDDFCQMVASILSNEPVSKFSELNIASGEARSVKSVVKDIQALIGQGTLAFGKMSYSTNRQMNATVAMDKWRKHFGSIPNTSWVLALQRTIEAYRDSETANRAKVA